jgi:hypothetical protein
MVNLAECKTDYPPYLLLKWMCWSLSAHRLCISLYGMVLRHRDNFTNVHNVNVRVPYLQLFQLMMMVVVMMMMKKKMMMIMSLGWDHVSELWLQLDLLFIPQMIYDHGEPWWNDISRGRLLIHLPELSGNPTSRVIY